MTTAQPGQEQRMDDPRTLAEQRRREKHWPHCGVQGDGPCDADCLNHEQSRPTADLGELVEAISDDECVICGKARARHHTGSGVGLCQIYPVFRSKREVAKALLKDARAVLSRSGG